MADQEEDSPDNSIVFENQDERPVDQTVIIDTKRLSELQALRNTKLNGLIEVLDSGRKVTLNKRLTLIGKRADSDIVITGFLSFLARNTTATISKKPDGYYISGTAGILKPKINNQSLKNAVKLKSMDTIRIGSFQMKFILE